MHVRPIPKQPPFYHARQHFKPQDDSGCSTSTLQGETLRKQTPECKRGSFDSHLQGSSFGSHLRTPNLPCISQSVVGEGVDKSSHSKHGMTPAAGSVLHAQGSTEVHTRTRQNPSHITDQDGCTTNNLPTHSHHPSTIYPWLMTVLEMEVQAWQCTGKQF